MRSSLCVVFIATLVTLCLSSLAVADPIPGRDVLKFSQLPMINTPLLGPDGNEVRFHGHDELSTAWGQPTATGPTTYSGPFMADDFADHFTSPIVHVKWWGSYMNRPTGIPDTAVRRFLISFESDIPAGPNVLFSRPGEPLLNQIVSLDSDGVLTKGEGTFTEKIVGDISVDGPIYEYNAELHLDKPFLQKAETVYWLKIVALVDTSPNIPIDQRLQWGWHNRDYTKMNPLASMQPAVVPGEFIDGFLPQPGGDVPIWHFQDDAVSGAVTVVIDPNMPTMPNITQSGFEPQNYRAPFDGPSLIATHSKDLAFQLFTIPEPGCIALALIALVGMGTIRPGGRS